MESGKFVLRIDPKFHRALKKEAQQIGESLNTLCVNKLKGAVVKDETYKFSEVVALINETFNPKGVVLFGSVARGEERESSDIDLLIVMEDSQEVCRDLYKLWDKVVSGEDVFSPQFVHLPKEGELVGSIWLETSIDGEVLYDRCGEIKNIYRKIRAEIASGSYVRKESHGHSYWVRQGSNAK